jgi:hypothetical protein
MQPPRLDAGRIGRLRDVFAGGHLARSEDRDSAAKILARWPGVADLVKDANDFHRRAAEWAVKGGRWKDGGSPVEVPPAALVIFGGSDYPVGGGFHAAASRASPGARFGYAAADKRATDLNKGLLASADPEHVFAWQARTREPGALLGAPEVKAVKGPKSLQLQLCTQWWPGEFAAWAVAEYARLLSSGSTLVLSLGVLGGGPGGDEFLADFGRAGGVIYPHTPEEVAGWFGAAKMILTACGITDVRAREMKWAAEGYAAGRPVARVIKAVAVVR